VTNVDVLTYAGNLANLDGVVEEHGERYEFFKADVANADQMDALMTEHGFYAVINFAAESHVDRSINDPLNFIHTNVIGTSVLLIARAATASSGSSRSRQTKSTARLGRTANSPSNHRLIPAAVLGEQSWGGSSGACLLQNAARKCSSRVARIITAHQFPEKLIPLMIIKALRDEPLPVYGDWMNLRD
jgi:dTDP-glucose 4,6-dehydratase